MRPRTRWIDKDALAAAFRLVKPRRQLARRIGRALVGPREPRQLSVSGGLATLEKAYRRCDALFAREEKGGSYQALSIEKGRAMIGYYPADHRAGRRPAECSEAGESGLCLDAFSGEARRGLCGVREGMLEALPLCFGLSPARSFDLARQLHAVAGARRGHLALLEQADEEIAQKMDELTKLNEALETAREERKRGRVALGERPTAKQCPGDQEVDELEQARASRAADEIHAALGPLQKGLDCLHGIIAENDGKRDEMARGRESLQRCVKEVQGLRRVGAELARCETNFEASRRTVSLATLVERSVQLVRPLLSDEELDDVFDPFAAEFAPGGGLGLAFCYRVVAEHRGEMQLSPREGGGNRVRSLLPAELLRDPAAQESPIADL